MYQPSERWKTLCEQAAVEQDGMRLLEIVNELNRVLDETATGLGTKPEASLLGSLRSSN